MADILLMEDDDVQSRLLCELLQEGGHETTPAYSCSHALEQMDLRAYDLVITDILVKSEGEHVSDGGIKLISKLRLKKTSDGRKIPIIAISGNFTRSETSAIGTLDIARTVGADACLSKPIDFENLFDTISSLMTERPI